MGRRGLRVIPLTPLERRGAMILVVALGAGQILSPPPPVDLGREVESVPAYPIDVQVASATEMQALPGVGPVLAARIVATRASRNGFDSVDDLLAVSGIGAGRLETLRPLVFLTVVADSNLLDIGRFQEHAAGEPNTRD